MPKPYDLPNRMRLRDESLGRNATKKERKKRMSVMLYFHVFSGCVWSRFVHRFLVSFFMKNGCQNGTKIDAIIVEG